MLYIIYIPLQRKGREDPGLSYVEVMKGLSFLRQNTHKKVNIMRNYVHFFRFSYYLSTITVQS